MFRVVLDSDRSAYWPPTCENTAEGYLFVANGLDDTLRVRRLSGTAYVAGIVAPATAATVAYSGSGTITGDYYAYVRYLDQDDIPSSLSPISTLATATNNLTVNYSSVPVSPNPRVTKREIYRNTDGQVDVFYLDATIEDNTTTTASSTKTDAQLQASTALPILNDDGSINANRFEPPPYHKAVAVQHQDRFWYAVDVPYTQGNVSLTLSSTTATGIDTAWTSSMAGRFLYLAHIDYFVEIVSVDTTAQTLVMAEAAPAGGVFGYYTIAPGVDERNKIYFSYPGEPESVPALNSFKIQEISGDEVTGLMPLGQFLFVLMKRHIYRIAFGLSPNDDLSVHKTVSRGALNQRCWVRVEDIAFLLDREGVHRFEGGHDGGRTEHISEPIQDLFRGKSINWTAQRWFHASHNPTEEVVRFHVCIGDGYLPKHAICYHYRHNAWWLESYPWGLGGNCLALLTDSQRCLLGGEYEQHFAQGEGTLDGVAFATGSTTTRAQVESATFLSITDSDAAFPKNVINAPIHIVGGRGCGQSNRVVDVQNNTLIMRRPWKIKPDSTSVYQLGGVPWDIVSGTYRFVREHQADDYEFSNRRRVRIACEPTDTDATIDVQLFLDHNISPRRDYVSYDSSDGVQTGHDQPRITLSIQRTNASPMQGEFSGYRHIDISSHSMDPRVNENWLTAKASGVQGRDPVIIYALGFDGVQ